MNKKKLDKLKNLVQKSKEQSSTIMQFFKIFWVDKFVDYSENKEIFEELESLEVCNV